MLAHQAGLATATYRQTSHDPADAGFRPLAPPQALVKRVIVLGDGVFGAAMPKALRGGCLNLAKLCRTPLLGIDFYANAGDELIFSFATPVPDLQVGGPQLLQAIGRLFQKGKTQ